MVGHEKTVTNGVEATPQSGHRDRGKRAPDDSGNSVCRRGHTGRGEPKSCSASLGTVRHSSLWGARTPPPLPPPPRVLRSSTANLDDRCDLWRIARQVWAKPSVRGVLWLVGYPSMTSRGCARIQWYVGCQEVFRARAWEGYQCRHGSPALGVGPMFPHALGCDQCGEQRGPDL